MSVFLKTDAKSCARRLLAFIFAAVAVSSMSCDLFRKRLNPPVLLLHKDSCCLFNPVVSNDDKHVYYLLDSTHGRSVEPSWELSGNLRVCGTDGRSDRLLLKGDFYALALSFDGQMLVAASYYGGRITGPNLFVVLDTSGRIIDSILVQPDTPDGCLVFDVAFTPSGETFIFDAWRGYRGDTTYFYEVDIATGTATLVQTTGWPGCGFDVCKDGTIYSDTATSGHPSVNRVNDRWVVAPWVVWDRLRRRAWDLGTRSRPYGEGSFVEFPCWTSDGRSVVFSARKHWIDSQPLELWLLEDVLDEADLN